MKPIYRTILGLILALSVVACDSTTEPPPPPPPSPTGTISGNILVEGAAQVGVTVNLTGPQSASTVSAGGGTFTFNALGAGQYTVSISGFSTGVQFAQTTNAVTVVAGQTATVAFVGTFVRTASISGKVLASGTGVEGATLTLSGTEDETAVSSPAGEYSFDGLRAGTFTVTLSGLSEDVTFTETVRQATLGVGDAATIDFTGIRAIPATVTITAFENAGGFRIGPNVLSGEIIVLVDLDQGTQSVTNVTVLVNGENVGEQVPPAAPAPALARQLALQRLRFNVNTTEFNAATGGPRFPNGAGTFQILVDTEKQGAAAAQFTQAVTFTNSDLIAGVNFLGGVEGVVSGGKTWWGGGDLNFEIVPVIYDPNRTLSAIDVRAIGQSSANGGPSLDFGSGLGAVHRVTGPPFLFTAPRALNDGFVEDDPARSGHTISVVGVFDGNGVNITSDFVPGRAPPLTGLHVDFVGPQMPPGTRLKSDAGTIFGGELFSSGVFGLSLVTELGVGGVTPRFDARVGGIVVSPNITTVDDLAERGLFYELILASVVDDLGNTGPVANVIPSGIFGVDRTPVPISGLIPIGTRVLNPDDDAGDGVADNQPSFTAIDPVLADGSTGSGYATATMIGTNAFGAVFDLSAQVSPNASGLNSLSPTILATGTYTFDLVVTDNAQPANSAMGSISFILDRTNPSLNMLNPPPGIVFSTNASLTFTITGNAVDVNGISSARLIVRDGGANGACEVTDAIFSQGTGLGQVAQNTFDVTATAAAISENVQIFNPQTTATIQVLCFYIEASDKATDVNGSPEGNSATAVARTSITWN